MTLDYGNNDIFLKMGNAGFVSPAVRVSSLRRRALWEFPACRGLKNTVRGTTTAMGNTIIQGLKKLPILSWGYPEYSYSITGPTTLVYLSKPLYKNLLLKMP